MFRATIRINWINKDKMSDKISNSHRIHLNEAKIIAKQILAFVYVLMSRQIYFPFILNFRLKVEILLKLLKINLINKTYI